MLEESDFPLDILGQKLSGFVRYQIECLRVQKKKKTHLCDVSMEFIALEFRLIHTVCYNNYAA